MTKFQLITKMYEDALGGVTKTPTEWTAFLHSSCKNYKCRFDEQLLIFTQRPDAIAVLEIEKWNRQFGRWVNKGATGIAVFDGEHNGNTRLKHYFDISDTHESRVSRPVPLWQMEEKYEPSIIESLENSFGELEEKESLSAAIVSVAKNIVEDNLMDYLQELLDCKEDSFLEELDDQNVEVEYRELLQNSVAYMLMVRCGIDTEQYFDAEDFRHISDFNTPNTANALGVATSDIAENCLREISATMRSLQRQEIIENRTFANRNQLDHNNTKVDERSAKDGSISIQERGRLSDTQPIITRGRGRSPWQVRITQEGLSEKEQENIVYESVDNGKTERSLNGNRGNSDEPYGRNDSPDDESPRSDGADESGKPNELGRNDEQHQAVSGGNDTGRTDIQLKTPSEIEPNMSDENAGSGTELPAFLSEELILNVLCRDQFLNKKISEIREYIEGHFDYDERTEYIKNSYNKAYTLFDISEHRVGYVAKEDGLVMWEGNYLTRTSESKFSWSLIQELIVSYIEQGQYYERNDRDVVTEAEPTKYKPLPTENQQLSFLSEAEEKQTSTFSISQQIIDEVLTSGGNEEDTIPRIISYFKKDHPLADNAKFLTEEYGDGGKGFIFADQHVSVWFNESGLHIALGDTALESTDAVLITWGQAASRTRELLDMGRYAPQSELDKADGIEVKAIADHLWYLHQDLAQGVELPFLDDEIFRGGFPDSTVKIAELVAQPSERDKLIEGLKEFDIAHEENRAMLRFHIESHSPKAILKELTDLQHEPLVFTADESVSSARPSFITQDEVDRVLMGGDGVHHGKYRIYSYFLQDLGNKEKAKFLSQEYGTGGSSRTGFDEWHDSKGLSYSRENNHMPYDKVILPWTKVAKRIDELIADGKYMNEKELAYIPEYEKEILSAQIYSFYYNQPEEVPCPYPIGIEHDGGVKIIRPQLDESERVTEILSGMEEILDNTADFDRHYERMQKTYADLSAYQSGKYSLFTKGKPVEKETLTEHQSEESKEAIEVKEPVIDERAEYDLALGVLVYLGTDEYEIYSFDDANVVLRDMQYPLFTKEMPRKEFDRKLRENQLNDHLIKMSDMPDMENESRSEGHTEVIETKPETQEEVNEDVKEEEPPAEKEETILPAWEQAKPKGRTTVFDSHSEIPMSERRNYQITNDEIGYGGPKTKFQNNIAAIKTLQKIELENRFATSDEQEILAQYVGWGGLAQAFDDENGQWTNEYFELSKLLSTEEYKSARNSTLNAYYTSPVIIKAIYKAVENMGFQTGNVLESSCGIGNFFGLVPNSMRESKFFGVEIDSLTGKIARQLYQKNNIAIQGFENTELPDSFFDLAVGNVPFGNDKVLDKRYDKHKFLIHDYFFAKALDKVRPGGIIAFVTSKGILDKANPAVRKYIAQRADLLGAIRLPNTAFKANAGTDVTADIIFLQKRDRIVDIEPAWVHLGETEEGIPVNSYFVEHPDMILGTMSKEDGVRMYGDMNSTTCVPFPDSDLSEQLSEAITGIHAEITEYEIDEEEQEEDRSIPADPNVRNFSYTLVEGQSYYRQDSRMVAVELPVTTQNRVKGMIELRESVRTLIEYQTQDYPDSDIEAEQARLNHLYDTYTKKYGLINSRGNSIAFAQDSAYCLLCSLEIIDENGELEKKADMFRKRTINPHIDITHVDTASEALAVSLAEKARIDLAFMANLTGMTEETLVEELDGVIFRNIGSTSLQENTYVTADEYLSGNIRQKLEVVKLAAEADRSLEVNVGALETAMPKDLTAAEISVRLGATWIPEEDVQEFMYELLQTPQYSQNRIKVHYSQYTGEWNVSEKSSDRSNINSFNTYGTQRINAYAIIEQALNLRDVRVWDKVYDENGDEKRVLNKKETAIAQAKQDLIRSKFEEWIWKDPNRRERLCRIYNDRFNSIRPREYDGSHIKFVGMNPEIKLRKHQIDAIARIMYGGNTLLAHEVGAGKTFEMVAATMESKRLGLCNKSLIVVPNHITEQWSAEFLQLYPSANILVATKKDFETKNRKKFCARIATGDYDAIVIGHSQFERIPMSIERQRQMIEKQIEEIVVGVSEAKRNRGEKFTIKQMVRLQRALETKLKKLNDQTRKDDVVTFEEIGVDRLFIDEAHYYKNLFLITKMRNVGGIAQTEAQKSSDLFMKCRYLDELTEGRGIIFATGTPISNSMVELYTMQRYLQYGMLEKDGLHHFDAWASTFGETVTAIELAPEGTGYRAKTRFAKFYNLPELMSLFKMVADIQTADMLDLPVPKANFHTEVIKPSQWQQDMVGELAERAEQVRNGNVDPTIDNMLKITNDGRKLALDQRLINGLLPDEPDSKISICAKKIFQIWEKTKGKRRTQIVFCDLSTPGKKKEIEMEETKENYVEMVPEQFSNIYEDLKKKLIASGIPEEEIAFIHTANTARRKTELFGKVRKGQVRILMGSTPKMGAGTNVQDRLITLHDIDCPWRPSDLTQRLGRIVRQGNKNPEVEIFRYVTEGTFDSYLYQLVENKQKFIAQIMTSKTPVRIAEDVDETALSYAEIKALATGNPLIIEKCQLEMDVNKLKILNASHLSQKYALEDKILKEYPQEIKRFTERIARYKTDIETVSKNLADKDHFPSMKIGGNIFVEKADAGKAIIEACKKMNSPDPVPLGEYRGFSMILSFNTFGKEYRVTLSGALSHTVSLGSDIHGNITRLDNALEGLKTSLEHCENKLLDTQNQLKTAKGEVDRPFAKEEEYKDKSARLKEVNSLLNMDEKDNTVIDVAPDESEQEVQPRIAGQER